MGITIQPSEEIGGITMNIETIKEELKEAGWIETLITSDEYTLHVSHAPDVDLEDCFQAFCHDAQEMVYINGWMISEYEPKNLSTKEV